MNMTSHAAAYLAAFQEDMAANFRLIPNAEYLDRRFPLYAMYEYEDTSTLILRNGKSVRSYEFCYFDVCERADEATVQAAIAVLEDMAARYVPWAEPSHGFTMLSMVLLAEGAPERAVQKQIRRFRHEIRRRDPAQGYGWCSCRLCVVDMATGTCYPNSHGKELANRVRMTVKKVSRG